MQPGEQIKYTLPANMCSISHAAVTPRPTAVSWLQPSVSEVHNGVVYLTNASSKTIAINKGEHLADVQDTYEHQYQTTQPLPLSNQDADEFQFKDHSTVCEDSRKYLHLLSVDPDNVLSEEEKTVFYNLHEDFASVFTPQPGRYNGKWGYIDN